MARRRFGGWVIASLLVGSFAPLAVEVARAGADEPPKAQIAINAETKLEDFLKAVSKPLGVRLVWDPANKVLRDRALMATLTLDVAPERMLATVRSVLVAYDLVLVPLGETEPRTYWVSDAQQQGLLLRLKPESVDLSERTVRALEAEDGRFVTAVLRARPDRSARDLRAALTKLSTPNLGSVSELPEASALLVTDFAPTVCAMWRSVRLLDGPAEPVAPPAALETRLVSVRHARAENLARVLASHLAAPAASTPPTTAAPGPTPPAPVAAPAAAGPRITADARTNRLLVTGTPAELRTIETLLEGLDVPTEAPSTAPSPPAPPPLPYVLTLRSARARELANVLQAFAQSSTAWTSPDGSRPAFVADPNTNTLLVAASERVIGAVRAMVEALDPPK